MCKSERALRRDNSLVVFRFEMVARLGSVLLLFRFCVGMDCSQELWSLDEMLQQEEQCYESGVATPVAVPPEAETADTPPDEILLPTQLEFSEEGADQQLGQDPAEPVAAAPPPSSPPKRRRILSKSVPAGFYRDASQSPSPQPGPHSNLIQDGDDTDSAWWNVKSHRDKYDYVYNKLRREGFRDYKAALEKEDPPVTLPESHSRLTKEDKTQVLHHWITQGAGLQEPLFVLQWARVNMGVRIQSAPGKGGGIRLRSKQVLVTCQGDWGLLEVPADLSLSPDPELVTNQVKQMAAAAKVWRDVQGEALRLITRLGADDYAVCLELCASSWRAHQVLRLHAHVAAASLRPMTMYLESRKLRFLGSPAHITSEDCSRRKRAVGWQTFYYVCAPKIGSLWSWASKQPFVDYQVSCEWIWSLLQSRKISLQQARDEMVRQTKCLTRHLPNVDRVRSELVALQLKDTIAKKEEEFQKHRKPFRTIKAVDALVADLRVARERRRFLVLDGPSRLGKTQYAMSLFGREHTLEVNAACEESPNLAGFDHTKHKAVLLDEAPPEMVLRNRKMFQCPNAMVQLAQSKTSCHSYEVYLNDTLLIICSNSWSISVSQSPAVEASWIIANQVLVTITEPMWQT